MILVPKWPLHRHAPKSNKRDDGKPYPTVVYALLIQAGPCVRVCKGRDKAGLAVLDRCTFGLYRERADAERCCARLRTALKDRTPHAA